MRDFHMSFRDPLKEDQRPCGRFSPVRGGEGVRRTDEGACVSECPLTLALSPADGGEGTGVCLFQQTGLC